MPVLVRDGQPIHYELRGDGPRTLVLAHNLMTDARIFDAHVASWARLGRVVAVDLRGHAGSAGITRSFSTADLADDVAAILDDLGARRAVMVGVSLGASTAMELVTRHPSRVEALVLMGGTGRTETTGDAIA